MKRQRHAPPRRPRQRREVLTEEDYTATLSSIIQRDYFPESNILLHQDALLSKRLAGDVMGAVEVRRAARRLMEHDVASQNQRLLDDNDLVSIRGADNRNNAVVAVSSTNTDGSAKVRKRARPLGEETVTGFHARVTNEDDCEFETTQQREVEANRKRLYGVFNNNVEGNSQNNISRHRQILQLEDELASDDFMPEPNRLTASEWKDHSHTNNSFFFSPGETLLTADDKGHDNGDDDEKKLPALQSSIFGQQRLLTSSEDSITPSNSSASKSKAKLMLPPSQTQTQKMITSRQTNPDPTTTRPPAKHELVEYIPKSVIEHKMIDPSQTRFPTSATNSLTSRSIIPGHYYDNNSNASNNASTGIVNLSASSYGFDANISDTEDESGMSVTDASQYSTDLDAPLRSIEEERRNRDRQEKRQYSQEQYEHGKRKADPNFRPFVPMSPLTTWGTVDGAPSEQEGGEEHSTKIFVLAGESQRERAARHAELELARRARRVKEVASSSREGCKRDTLSSSSSVHSRRRGSSSTGSLTPAAMALLGKATSSNTGRSDKFSESLRRSYTPKVSSSSSRRSASASMSSNGRRNISRSHGMSDHAFNATPLTSRNDTM